MKIDNNLELKHYKEFSGNSYYCLTYNKDNIFRSISFCSDGIIIGYDDFKIIFNEYKDQNNIIIEYIDQQIKQHNKSVSMVPFENIIKLFSDLIKKEKEDNK